MVKNSLPLVEQKVYYHAGHAVLTEVDMWSLIIWGIIPYSQPKINQHLGGTYCTHIQGRTVSQARNQHEAGSKHKK
jgi:hypothetical protein